MFIVAGTSDRLWNFNELVQHLSNHKDIVNLKICPEAICLKNLGLYDLLDCFNFKQVNIYTNNPFENHKKYNIIYNENYHWFFEINYINSELHSWNRNKLFYCLFGRPTAGRLGLAAYLLAYRSEKSLIHFSAALNDDNLIQFELNKLLEYRSKSINEAGNLINQLPLLLSSSDRYTSINGYDYTDTLTQFYKEILIDIVVESHVAGKTFYVTEKTIRPILLKKSFIVFASRDYLNYLRQLGFKTFGDFWDEDYDGVEGRDRFNKILNLIDILSNKSNVELELMYNNMQHILEHNYNLLLSKQFNKNIKEIV